MEIILTQDVERLGVKDDIVTVKSGYGRNFLIPGKKAIAATPTAKKYWLKILNSALTKKLN